MMKTLLFVGGAVALYVIADNVIRLTRFYIALKTW
jgi:hypothetical protein